MEELCDTTAQRDKLVIEDNKIEYDNQAWFTEPISEEQQDDKNKFILEEEQEEVIEKEEHTIDQIRPIENIEKLSPIIEDIKQVTKEINTKPKKSLLNFNPFSSFTKSKTIKLSAPNPSIEKNIIKSTKSNTHILDVDVDTLVYLMNFLSVETMLSLKQVNRRFKYIVDLDRVWAKRLKDIQFNAIQWDSEIDFKALKPELILKTLWQIYEYDYLQFRNIQDSQLDVFTNASQFPLKHISNKLYYLQQVVKAKITEDWTIINFNMLIIKEYYEASLLNNLNIAYSEMDLDELKTQCLALQGLQGNNLGIKWLVEQNPIFTFGDYKVPETLDDLEMIYEMMQDYFKKLQSEIILENELLLKIFEDSQEGNTVFIIQLFRDCISGFLIPLLSIAEEQSDMEPSLYGKILVQCLLLAKQWIIDLNVPMDKNKVVKNLFYLFRPYLNTLVKNELLFLDLNYSTLSKNFLFVTFGTNFNTHNNNSSNLKNLIFDPQFLQNQKKLLFDSMSKAIKSTNLLFNNNNNINNLSGYNTNNNNNDIISEIDLDFTQFISIELANKMIILNEESINRIIQFKYFINEWEGLLSNNMEKIFAKLVHYLLYEHLNKVFDIAFKQLRKHQSYQFQTLKNDLVEPVTCFFNMIEQADKLQELVDIYYKKQFKNHIDFNDFLNSCNIIKKKFETNLDEIVANGLDLSIQTLMHHVHLLLKHYQNPNDFKPATPISHLKPTQACQEVVNCLIAHVTKVRNAKFDTKVLEVFYNEIALRLFQEISKNIKLLTFNQSGGYQLLSDLSGYFSWVITLDIPDIVPHFQALKEIANVYLLDLDNLKVLLQDNERFLGIFHPEELLEFVQCREDYKKIQKKIEVEGCLVM